MIEQPLDALKIAEPFVLESLPYLIVEVNPERNEEGEVVVDIQVKAF